MASSEVRHYLLPLPGHSRSSPPSSAAASTDPVVSRLERQLRQGQEQIQNLKRKFEGKGDSDKGKGKGRKGRKGPKGHDTERRKPAIVEEMKQKGYLTRSKGDAVCFKYNLAGCSDAAPGQRCPKGWHVCAHKRCKDRREPHAANTH